MFAKHAPSGAAPEGPGVEQFGYAPTLHKDMRWFRSTMVAVSTTSVTTAIFTLFAFGIGTGGTGFIWTWAAGFVVMLLVTLAFAELGAEMPIAGAIYQWASRQGGATWGYLTGWLYGMAQTAILGTLGLAIAPIIGSLLNFTPTTLQSTVIALLVIVAVNTINLLGVQVVARLTTIGAIAELSVMIGLTLLLVGFGLGHQSVGVVVQSHGLPSGSHFLPVALATMLFGSWPYTGLEMPTDMAEETHDAAKAIPRAGILNIIVTFTIGMIFLLVVLWAAPGNIGSLASDSDPLRTIIVSAIGLAIYKIFAVFVVIAIVMSMVGNQALTARIIFSLARDQKFPASNAFTWVPNRTGVPVLPTVFVALVSCVLVFYSSALAVIGAAAIAGLFLAYQMGIWPAVYLRVTGRWTPKGFNLGRAAKPVYIGACLLGTALVVNVGWPRTPELVWYKNYASLLFVGATFLAAGLYYVLGGHAVRDAIRRPLPGTVQPVHTASDRRHVETHVVTLPIVADPVAETD